MNIRNIRFLYRNVPGWINVRVYIETLDELALALDWVTVFTNEGYSMSTGLIRRIKKVLREGDAASFIIHRGSTRMQDFRREPVMSTENSQHRGGTYVSFNDKTQNV